jgi:hypothetical protein
MTINRETFINLEKAADQFIQEFCRFETNVIEARRDRIKRQEIDECVIQNKDVLQSITIKMNNFAEMLDKNCIELEDILLEID